MKFKVLYTNARACDTILQYIKYSRIIKNVKMYNVHNRKLQLKCQWTSIFLIKTKQYRVHVDDCPLGYIPYFFILNRLIQHISNNVNYIFPRLVKKFSEQVHSKETETIYDWKVHLCFRCWMIYIFFRSRNKLKQIVTDLLPTQLHALYEPNLQDWCIQRNWY